MASVVLVDQDCTGDRIWLHLRSRSVFSEFTGLQACTSEQQFCVESLHQRSAVLHQRLLPAVKTVQNTVKIPFTSRIESRSNLASPSSTGNASRAHGVSRSRFRATVLFRNRLQKLLFVSRRRELACGDDHCWTCQLLSATLRILTWYSRGSLFAALSLSAVAAATCVDVAASVEPTAAVVE